MTSAMEHKAHPDVIELSDLAEDLLPAERAADVRTHVASCPHCAEVLDSLREIGALLGGVPTPEPMPADVAARIDAALASEAVALDGRAASDVGTGTEPAFRDVPRGTSARGRSDTAGDVPRGTFGPAGRPSGSTGPGRTGRRRRRLLVAALSCAGVLVLGGLVYLLPSHSTSSHAGSDAGSTVRGSAGDAGPAAAVGAHVARLLGSDAGAKSGGDAAKSPMLGGGAGTTVVAPDGSVTSVPACVLQATRRTEQPLAAEREDFQGVDSYLVVLPDPAGTSQVDAFVLTAACTAGTPARVLFQNSYPRS